MKLHDQLIAICIYVYQLNLFVVYLMVFKEEVQWHVESGQQLHQHSRSYSNSYCMNWLHFKPEFSGKPDEDVEMHIY